MANKVRVSYAVGSEGNFTPDSIYKKSSIDDYGGHRVLNKSDETLYEDVFVLGSTANQLATPEKFGLYNNNYNLKAWKLLNTTPYNGNPPISATVWGRAAGAPSRQTWTTSFTYMLGSTEGGNDVASWGASIIASAGGTGGRVLSKTLDFTGETGTYYLTLSYQSTNSETYATVDVLSLHLIKGRKYDISIKTTSQASTATFRKMYVEDTTITTTDGDKYFYVEDDLKADAIELAYNIENVDETAITLHAIWERKPFIVKYNSNGGRGLMNDSDFKAGVSNVLTSNSFKKPRYKFIGWNTKNDGSGVSFKDGGNFPNNALEYGEVVTLYAQWERTKFPRGFYVFINGKWEYCKPYIYLEKKDLVSKDGYEILDANGLELEGDDSWENIH